MSSQAVRAKLAIALLVLCGVVSAGRLDIGAVRGVRAAREKNPAVRGAPFELLFSQVPRRAVVGWIAADNADDAMLHAIQYALVPRVVVQGTDADWIVVAPGADVPGAARSGSLELVQSDSSGLRLYRRTAGR